MCEMYKPFQSMYKATLVRTIDCLLVGGSCINVVEVVAYEAFVNVIDKSTIFVG